MCEQHSHGPGCEAYCTTSTINNAVRPHSVMALMLQSTGSQVLHKCTFQYHRAHVEHTSLQIWCWHSSTQAPGASMHACTGHMSSLGLLTSEHADVNTCLCSMHNCGVKADSTILCRKAMSRCAHGCDCSCKGVQVCIPVWFAVAKQTLICVGAQASRPANQAPNMCQQCLYGEQNHSFA